MSIDRKRLKLHFDRAAPGYERNAYVQRNILQKAMLHAKNAIAGQAEILDAGCGTGALARHEIAREKNWKITQIDLSHAMCREASAAAPAIQGDITALPFPPAQFDAVLSLSTLQWVNDIPAALKEIHRVLRPGGIGILYSFGPETLRELRSSFVAAGNPDAVNRFTPLAAIIEDCDSLGFAMMESGSSIYTDYFLDVGSLLHSIKAIGAASKATAPYPKNLRKIFTGMQKEYEKYRLAGGLPVSWDVMHLVIRK